GLANHAVAREMAGIVRRRGILTVLVGGCAQGKGLVDVELGAAEPVLDRQPRLIERPRCLHLLALEVPQRAGRPRPGGGGFDPSPTEHETWYREDPSDDAGRRAADARTLRHGSFPLIMCRQWRIAGRGPERTRRKPMRSRKESDGTERVRRQLFARVFTSRFN